MNYFKISLFFINIYFCITKINGENIRNIYFDRLTSVEGSKRDGIVVIETISGVRATICINQNYDRNNAEVICRMMGYDIKKTNPSAISLITSEKSFSNNGTHYENIQCTGKESDLSQCVGFQYKTETSFRCRNHNQDMHVMCFGEYFQSTAPIIPSYSNCSNADHHIASLSKGTHGLLKIRNGTDEFTVCGKNRNFGTNEALLFCNVLICQNSTYARIIEGYTSVGASIGGFKNMKCPPGSSSLSECVNVYPHDKEGCTPNDNIGVICSLEPFVADPYPEVNCDGRSLSLVWKKSIHANIEPSSVSIINNGTSCKDVKIDKSVKLTVNYADCGMLKMGDNDTIIYSFQVKRTYPKFNNIILTEDQLYDVSCIIPRNASTSETSFLIDSSSSLPTIGNYVQINNVMTLSLDSKFLSKVSNIQNVKVGTEIFVKVQLIKAPSQLVPFLEYCAIETNTAKEALIINKCAARNDVVISPLDNVTIMFSFKAFAIGSVNQPTKVNCLTSMCGRNTIGCIPTCQQLF